jgi:hypothetical protein
VQLQITELAVMRISSDETLSLTHVVMLEHTYNQTFDILITSPEVYFIMILFRGTSIL